MEYSGADITNAAPGTPHDVHETQIAGPLKPSEIRNRREEELVAGDDGGFPGRRDQSATSPYQGGLDKCPREVDGGVRIFIDSTSGFSSYYSFRVLICLDIKYLSLMITTNNSLSFLIIIFNNLYL